MSELFRLPRLHSSIFAKLLAIALGTGLVIPLTVGGFFWMMVRPFLRECASVEQAQLQTAHDRMLLGLLVALVVIVFAGHALLRRTLEPIRWLREGVASLSEGNLEVAVPRRTSDELGALTEAFNQMVGKVREMVRARDQLLLDVSHELRSPLTRMKVALELCAPGEHTQQLGADVAEMEAMVTELLELERLRQGRGLRIERQDLMEVVRDAISAFEDRPPGVRLGTAPAQVLLSMDADKVRAVFGNLLENASKYALPDSAPTRIMVRELGERIVVRIEDDGPGIPEQDLPSLFEPFFRVDRSRSKSTGGYGLGLSLCKRMMEAHGGSIAVENNPRRGATFLLSFRSRGELPGARDPGRDADMIVSQHQPPV
jgi:signal transduction histidine kinase